MVNPSILDRFRLDGKTAIVTGVGPGIGSHVARAYAQAGANVVLAARTQQKVEKLAAEIAGDGGTALAVPCDVGLKGDVERRVDAAQTEYGSVEILFHNAAATRLQGLRNSLDASDEDWVDCLNVNLLAPYRLARMLVPAMKAKGNGSIINVLTTAAFTVVEPQTAYACTKAGLALMTRYLAKECAPEVRVNAICPGTTGPVGVPAEQTTGAMAGVMPFVPMHRVGSADEHIGAALLLASDAATYTTGQVIFVDGGRVNTLGGQAYATADGRRPTQ